MNDGHPTGEVRPVIVETCWMLPNAGCERRNTVLRGLSERVCATEALPITLERRIIGVRSRQMGESPPPIFSSRRPALRRQRRGQENQDAEARLLVCLRVKAALPNVCTASLKTERPDRAASPRTTGAPVA